MSPRSDWQEHAACRGHHDPEVFFPHDRDGSAAKVICQRCPVTTQCLEASVAVAAEVGITYGVWGCLTAEERKHLQLIKQLPMKGSA